MPQNKRYIAPAPNANRVDSLHFIAPVSTRPDAPCGFCGVREGCRHRGISEMAA
jgi:hypothetical protein